MKTTLTDGSPVPEDNSHTKLKPNGQQEGYVVLSEEERAKGFVEPVRESYIHVGKRPIYPLRELTEEEKQKWSNMGYTHYEKYPDNHAIVGCYWTEKDLNSGCNGLTTMSPSLAETYAREPEFYGATFCAYCMSHFRVGEYGEFVWAGTNQKVGTRRKEV